MTEKRYSVDLDEAIIDNKTHREYTTWDISGVEDICERMNELYDENEQLKSEIKDLKFENEKKYREIKQLEQMLQDVER